MTNTLRTTIAALGVGTLLAGGLAASQAMGATPADPPTPTPTTGSTAGPDLAPVLVFSSDEERMARDLYAAIADLYDGARPFSTITNSEQRHLDAVGALLDRYGVADPADSLPAGEYADPVIQQLYDDWLARARTSLDEAYTVGVELEQRDIADLENSIAGDLPADVDATLARLLNGSQMHLRAFTAAADGQVAGPAASAGNRGDGTAGNGRGAGMAGNGNGAGMMRGTVAQDGTGQDCPLAED